MKEVQAERIKIPENEPELSVGIILPEDELRELEFEVRGDYTYNNKKLVTGKLEIINNEICFNNQLTSELTFIASQGSILFKNLVAGRSFHWKNKYDLEFTGNFKIIILDGFLCVINIISFEEYLACVISSEMSASAPLEYCKAQAIVARSWAYIFLKNKHQNLPYTICNDDCCQRYQGITFTNENSFQAIKECYGLFVINSDNYVVPTYYSKSCGGISEDSENVFGFSFNGLSSIKDGGSNFSYCDTNYVNSEDLKKYLGKVDVTSEYYTWTKDIDLTFLSKKLGFKKVSILEILQRGISGRIIKIKVTGETDAGLAEKILESQYEIREKLDPKFLYSSAFKIRNLNYDKQTLTIDGRGWGHGVGLCQIGALGMSLKGINSEKIIEHYFPNTSLIKAY